MASRSLGTLTLDLIARIGGFQQGMDQASRSLSRTGSAADSAAARVSAMQGSFTSLSGVAATVSASLASAFSLQAVYAASEAYTTLTSRMLLVTEGSAQLAAAQKAVFSIAQSSYQPLTATAELYQRIATNQKELKLSGEGVAGIVGTISKTMAISGANAASANAALIQLGQAFASGTLRGEELNSVMEQAPALAQAIAAGMGKTVGELRTLGAAGLLTADAVVKALQAQQQAVDELFGKTAVTIGNSLTALENSFTQVVGRLDQASGVSATISSSIVSASKALDGFTSNATTTAKTIQSFSSAAETLAYVFGARLALSGAQAASSFALATKASIQQAAALVATTAAQWGAVNADSAASRQALETAKSRQADALALMERARLEVVTAEQKIAADRMRQTSEINNLKSVQATLAAERSLEGQRLKAQINEQGRALAIARMAAARLDEVAIIRQIQAAEAQLAATTAATSAEMQAAYAVRTAAVAAYGETTLAVNAAVRTSDAATAAASNASKAILLTAAAGRGLLALLTGPVGLIVATGLVAASFFSMRTSADEATQALSAHGATVDEVREKYEKLSGAQQRVKRLEWIDEQQQALSTASSALDNYAFKIERGIDLGPQTKQFRTMIEEVERGQRTLDSVTTWIESQASLYPEFRKEIAGLTRDYDNNVQKADELKAVLRGLDGETKKVSQSTEQMRAALNASQEQTKGQVAKWEEYIGKLRETRDLFGANKKAQAEFEASKMGLNDKQREEARLVASQIDVMDKYKDAVKAGDKAKQQSLRKELEAIYARQQALADAAAAEKKLQDAANKAAEESANKKISEMQRVLEAANKVFNAAAGFSAKSSFLTGRNMLLASPEQQSITGRSMVAPGSPTPSVGVAPRKSPQQLAAERLAQIEATTDRNKTAGDKAANALKKRFETMEEGYKRQIELINTSTDKRKNATEVEKLAFELASGKLEGVNAKQRKVLEGLAAELDAKKALLKADQDAKKLAALKFNLAEDNRTTQDGFEQELAGAGRGEKYRAQLREKLSIEQDFNKQRREMYKEYKEAVLANDPDAEANYKKETQMLDEALAERLAIQQDYYDKKDEMQSNWLDGAKDAWQDYSDHARDLSSQMYDVTSNALSSLEDELVNFVKTGKFNFEEFAAGIAEDLLRMLVRIGLQMAVNAAIGNTAAAASSALAVATGTAMATAYAPAAALASLASFGANAAPASAALTTTTGLASSLALVGMAHDGIDSVPREGTWLLQKGERVTTAGTSAKLDKTLESIQSQGGDQGQWNSMPPIQQHISVQGAADEATLSRIQEAAKQGAQMGYQMVLRDFRTNGPARQQLRKA
ncbi:phage tail tape measure protein [Pseudomonas sp. SWRI107]|uniref:phage tail tape measure protein n=1 Tax=Pseudomonas farsensis TaxID=2745492 RepID=UPI0016481CCD|nr:phage tail tape measure protein [Pseudomonas farsensis]MBV4531010.1 phage tail tape measure protein [Pseudomonas farsensis]